MSYMTNGHKYHDLAPNQNWILTQLLISAKRDCSGTITNPQTGWTESFSVLANNITTIEIPEAQAYVDGVSEQVQNKGLQVVTDDTVSVFCTNIAYLSFDASYVLPSQSLANNYVIQTYEQSTQSSIHSYITQNQTSAFLIVATDDNTMVNITPTVSTLGNHGAGQTFHVTLNRGQVYQVRSNKNEDTRDLSGSTVTSDKPIAVFNGNTLTAIPNNRSTLDHIFEQAMPIQSWGKRFVVTASLERNQDYVKITSATDNNEIRKNGEVIATLNEGQSHTFELTNSARSCFIECTGPAAVYLYNTTSDGSNIGDPSVVWIAPIEQRIDDITFSTFNNQHINITTHHVNIIVNSDDAGDVLLDGNPIPANEFETVNGNSNFKFVRKNINHGVHRQQCFNGFNAHVYGFGSAKGYAYLVGSKTIDLSTRVTMNGTFVPKQGTYDYCPEASITFEAEVNTGSADLLWDFGDGTTSTQNPVDHTYHQNGLYEVVLTATSKGNTSTDISHYFVNIGTNTLTESAELCKGSVYDDHGFHVVITNDTILETEIDNPVYAACKDSLFIYITALDGFYADYHDTICWQDEPFTYTDHGFSIYIDHPDTFTEHISGSTPSGCDSIVDLTVIVTDRIISPNPVEYHGCAESFTWNEVIYTESGDYSQVFTSSTGCDSIVELHISLNEPIEGGTDTVTNQCTAYEWHEHLYDQSGYYTSTIPSSLGCDSIVHLVLDIVTVSAPSEIQPMDTLNKNPHWVITASEYEINYYDFTLVGEDPNMAWDSVQWRLDGFQNWIIQPFGEDDQNCRIVVLDRVEDTVWLTAVVFDHCNPGVGTECRYWLLCSFYGTEEDPFQPQIDIVPNPNNGEMDLITNHLEGPVSVKVYNMNGLLIDQFTITDPQGRHHYNALSDYPAGVYLMAFSHKRSSFTKRVVITK